MPQTRRSFLQSTAAALAAAALSPVGRSFGAEPDATPSAAPSAPGASREPWYRRAVRWGQTNITERDPTRYDIAWWREHWKRTAVQGVVINAGGIVAYYPSALPLHHRAEFLGDRDLFGELCRAAHDDGLAVFARMDSNSAHEDFYRAHPDWFAVDAAGKPYRNRELYIACVNSPYVDEHIAAVLREIATRYRPEGFTDNSWSGLDRNRPCYCRYCEEKFRARTGQPIPRTRDWSSAVYREWIAWNYERRLEIWARNNRITREAGGPDCLWVGMNGGHVAGQAEQFRDCRRICQRAEILMLDDQRRQNETGFQRNTELGLRMHGLLGWNKVMPESMAMYQTTSPTFRLSAKPPAEARLWMLAGFAGGVQPWWHHVGAFQEDRRQFATAEPVMRWHAANERLLLNRTPVASIGIGWTQENADYFGRDDAALHVDLPYNGWWQALLRARIPSLPVHLDDLDREGKQLRTLILPNVAVLSEAQLGSIRAFVRHGGSVIATGCTSLADGTGAFRPDFALADLLGVRLPPSHGFHDEATRRRWALESAHTYLRLPAGPRTPGTTPTPPERHPIFRGFDDTDILPFGGTLQPLQVDASAQVLATFVPSFPVSPPEESWMRQPVTDIPAIVVRDSGHGGRVVYLPADIDRRYARDNLPDHGDLLATLVRWAAAGQIPLQVDGPGLVDCQLYAQHGRTLLHVVNLTSTATWRAPAEEPIAVGPLRVKLRLPSAPQADSAELRVRNTRVPLRYEKGYAAFELPSVLEHELIVIS